MERYLRATMAPVEYRIENRQADSDPHMFGEHRGVVVP